MVAQLPNQPAQEAAGLIEASDNKARLCYALPGGERPESFESASGTKHMLFELQRTEAPQKSSTTSGKAGEEDLNAAAVLISSNNLHRANLVDREHAVIGTIDQVLISRDGSAAHAVVSVGRVLGVGGTQIAVPLQAITAEQVEDPDQSTQHVSWLRLDADVKRAPKLETAEHLELSDAAWLTRNFAFFGIAQQAQVSQSVTPTHSQDMLAADRLINGEVFGRGGESLAYLDALILRLDGQPCVPFAILGYGGVLGVGKNFVAIDFSKLQIGSQGDEVRIIADLDSNGLAALQRVTPADYPELRLQSVRQRVEQ